MNNINAIGLDNDKAKHLAEKLNELLANYSIFYDDRPCLFNELGGVCNCKIIKRVLPLSTFHLSAFHFFKSFIIIGANSAHNTIPK